MTGNIWRSRPCSPGRSAWGRLGQLKLAKQGTPTRKLHQEGAPEPCTGLCCTSCRHPQLGTWKQKRCEAWKTIIGFPRHDLGQNTISVFPTTVIKWAPSMPHAMWSNHPQPKTTWFQPPHLPSSAVVWSVEEPQHPFLICNVLPQRCPLSPIHNPPTLFNPQLQELWICSSLGLVFQAWVSVGLGSCPSYSWHF